MSVYADIMRRKSGSRDFDRIFCIGLHKTGTTSLAEFFNRLGLRAHHGVVWSRPPIPNEITESHDAFSDGGGHFWDDSQEFGGNHAVGELDRAYPGSRFILSTRPLDSWLTSKLMHAGWAPGREEEVFEPALAEGEAPPHEAWRRRSRALVHKWIDNRERYHAAVRAYFAGRERDLLEVDIASQPDAAERIVDFLGLADRVVWADRSRRMNQFKTVVSPGRIHVAARMPHQNTARPDAEVKAYCREVAQEVLAAHA